MVVVGVIILAVVFSAAFAGHDDTVHDMCANFLSKVSSKLAVHKMPLVISPEHNDSLFVLFVHTGTDKFVKQTYNKLQSHPDKLPYAVIIVTSLANQETYEAQYLFKTAVDMFKIPAKLVFTWNLTIGEKSQIPFGTYEEISQLYQSMAEKYAKHMCTESEPVEDLVWPRDRDTC